MEETKMKKVKLIAIKAKYRDRPMFVAPIWNANKKGFDTGQKLTLNQMTGKDPLGVNKGKYGIIINPYEQYPVIHNTKLEFSKDGKDAEADKDIYNFLLTVKSIAQSKSKAINGIHEFYMEDLEFEAVESVTQYNKVYEILKKVKEDTSVSRYEDIAIFLGYNVRGLTANMIEEKILMETSKHPDKVSKFFETGAEDMVFARKLKAYELIKQHRDAFYDGEIFLGKTIEEVSQNLFLDEHKNTLSKLSQLLDKKIKESKS